MRFFSDTSRLLALAAFAAFTLSLHAAAAPVLEQRTLQAAGDARPIQLRIYRDGYGTPQVFADSNYGVYFGYGYVVASDRLFQMEMLKRTAQGRVAEVLGAKYRELDELLRTHYDQPSVRRQVQALAPRDREILEGYAHGFNARLDELRAEGPAALPQAFAHFDFAPTRWTAYDVASIFVGSIAHRYADFNSERDNLQFLQAMEARHGKERAWALFSGVKWLLDDDSPTTVPRRGEPPVPRPSRPSRPEYLDRLAPAPSVARLSFDEQGYFAGLSSDLTRGKGLRRLLAERGFPAHPEFAPASNYWAMSDLQDASGALLNGPQFGFSMPSYVYGVGLHGGDFDLVGNTLLALPAMLFAHNNHIAWGSTAGLSDQTDEYLLELNPTNPEQYRYQGAWRAFERWEERIAVRDAQPVTVIARRAAQGMVLDYRPDEGLAWVRARTWDGQAVQDLMSWIWLGAEHSLEAAEQRIGGKVTNINMYTMDRTGRLGYVHSGRYPRRAPGHDPRLPAPGDGTMDWQGLRPYSDNPRVLDPEHGYIVNWNNRPSADWISSDLWSKTWGPADRVQILIDALEAMRGGSVAELVAINEQSSFADLNRAYLLPRLRAAVEKAPEDSGRQRAMGALTAWDGQWTPEPGGRFGPGPALMEAWLRHLLRTVFLDDVGEEQFYRFAATQYPSTPQGAAVGTPVGLRVLLRQLRDQESGRKPIYDFLGGIPAGEVLLAAFDAARAELEAGQGIDPYRWRLAAAPLRWLPVNFRGVPQALPDNVVSHPVYQNRGSENNVFVATGEGIVGRDVVPPGQRGHRAAAGRATVHRDDQLALYTDFAYKPLPFTETEVRAAAVSELRLSITR